MRVVAAGLFAGALAAGPAVAQFDPGAPEGAVRTTELQSALDSYDLPIGRFGPEASPVRRLEGAIARRAYLLRDSEATVAEVVAAYAARLDEAGFESIFECEDRGCGGFDFRFGAEILPPPEMRVDVRDFAHLSAEQPETGEHVSVLVSRVLDAIQIQTVAIAPAPPPGDLMTVAPDSAPVLPQDEQALLSTLMRDGHVRIDGLDFEPGGVALSSASDAVLDMLGRMLVRPEAPLVAIVGHSDNDGGLEFNLDLSRRRAESVMQALIKRGVASDRLEAHGLGYLAPVASNADEQGRSANRRVELVLR